MINDLEILETKAVDSAINLDWKEAIKINLQIIKLDPKSMAAYLRIGYAYLQSNRIIDSKKYYRKALKIQPKNTVALENLERIKILEEKKDKGIRMGKIILKPNIFIEIQGKTKAVPLVNCGQKDILAKLLIGQEVFLKIKKRRVEIRSFADEYIGSLPDDLSRRLIYFLKAKSKYNAYIKETSLNRVVVFIREEVKSKQMNNNISFPHNIQKNIRLSVEGEKPDGVGEETDDPEENWEKLAEGVVEDEKEVIVGIQTDEPEEEE